MKEKTVVIDNPDHIAAFQIDVYKQAIKALLRGMMINRNFTSTNCRSFVSRLTRSRYPAGKKGLQIALADLDDLTA